MALRDSTLELGTLEECMDEINDFILTLDQDEINDFILTLDRYPPLMVAATMRAHLEALLRALLECDMCSRREVRQFVQELEQEVLEEADA